MPWRDPAGPERRPCSSQVVRGLLGEQGSSESPNGGTHRSDASGSTDEGRSPRAAFERDQVRGRPQSILLRLRGLRQVMGPGVGSAGSQPPCPSRAAPRAVGSSSRRATRSGLPALLVILTVSMLSAGCGPSGWMVPHVGPPSSIRPFGIHPYAAAISLSPTSGPHGSTVSVSGTGFGSPVLASVITISFDGTTISTSPSTCYTTSSAFTCSFSAPHVNGGHHTVTATGGGDTASATFTETGSLWFSPSSVDVGQNVSVTGAEFGPSLTISSFTLGDVSLNCTGATVGSCSSGTITTNSTGWFNVTFVAPAVAASGVYNVTATDDHGKSESGNLSTYLDPTVATPTATPASVDVGQIATFQTAASLGSGGFSYNWSGLRECSGTTNPLRCAPTTIGVTNITVTVTDSNGFRATSDPLPFTVFPDPAVSTPNASRDSADVGQFVTFVTNASNGTGVYQVYIWHGLPAGCDGANASVSCAPQSAGSSFISVAVTDSNGRTSARSGTRAFAVDADPTVPTPVSNRTSADVGQMVAFSGAATLGSGGNAYAWTGLPTGCNATTPAVVCTMAESGTFAIQLGVIDSNGFPATSGSLRFQVFDDPSASIQTTQANVDVGQPFTLSGSVAAGSGGTMYFWSGLPTGCVGSTPSITCSSTQPGNYTVSLRVTDSNGFSSAALPIPMTVSPRLVASFLPIAPAPRIGQVVTFSSTSIGGTGTRTCTWSFGDESTGTGAVVDHSYQASGTYTVVLTVNDTAGVSAKSSTRVTVVANTSTTAPGRLGTTGATVDVLILGGALAIAAVVGVSVMFYQRRKGRYRPPETPNGSSETGPEHLP